jgi:hypothetical protein
MLTYAINTTENVTNNDLSDLLYSHVMCGAHHVIIAQ